MSYILDALKKSESERQRQNAPGFADVPAQTRQRGTPIWIWLVSGLLLINATILAVLLARGFFATPAEPAVRVTLPLTSLPVTAPAAVQARPATQRAEQRPAPQPRAEADVIPSQSTPQRPPVQTSGSPASVPNQPAIAANPDPASGTSTASLPTLLDLSAAGTLQLPELHLDVHVFSQSPQDRFVFINMSKYREAARLADGPLVKEIVADGVILEYQGNTFLLPRD